MVWRTDWWLKRFKRRREGVEEIRVREVYKKGRGIGGGGASISDDYTPGTEACNQQCHGNNTRLSLQTRQVIHLEDKWFLFFSFFYSCLELGVSFAPCRLYVSYCVSWLSKLQSYLYSSSPPLFFTSINCLSSFVSNSDSRSKAR